MRLGGVADNLRPAQQRTEAIDTAAVRAAAAQIKPQALTWVIVGDLSTIEAPVRELELGEVTVLDADGKKLR